MKQRLYVLYDRRAREIASAITHHQNDVNPIRDLQHSLKAGNNVLADYPDDFDLLCIGEIETSTGEIKPNDTIQIITTATEHKPKPDVQLSR